jgi:hypothetical protein
VQGIGCQGPHHRLVAVACVGVAVDPLDHPHRAGAGDLGEEEGVDAGAEGVGDEAVPEQVGVYPLGVEAGALGGMVDELEQAAARERLVLAAAPSAK